MSKDRIPITLATLANGALEEVFQFHLVKVLDNIDDESIDQAAKRKIAIELTFEPVDLKGGRAVDLSFKVTAKLATIPAQETTFAFVKNGAGYETSEQPPLEQLEIPGARAAKKPTLVTH